MSLILLIGTVLQYYKCDYVKTSTTFSVIHGFNLAFSIRCEIVISFFSIIFHYFSESLRRSIYALNVHYLFPVLSIGYDFQFFQGITYLKKYNYELCCEFFKFERSAVDV